MKILLTGSAGFIGSYVKELIPDAVSYDRKEVPEDNIQNVEHLTKILRKNNIDTIIHLAAYVSIPDSEKLPATYIKNNVYGTMQVIDAALRAGVKKIVYASSSASYEPSSSVYAFTKYAPELLLEHYKDKIEVVSLRFFNVYGKGSNPAYARVIDEFIKGIKEKGKVTIFGDGEQTRDFIHVKDIAKGIKAAAEANDIISGSILDFGTGRSITINELAGIIGEFTDKKVKINYEPPRVEVKHSKPKYPLTFHFPQLNPLITLEEGLKELL